MHGFFLNEKPVKLKGNCNHQDRGLEFARLLKMTPTEAPTSLVEESSIFSSSVRELCNEAGNKSLASSDAKPPKPARRY